MSSRAPAYARPRCGVLAALALGGALALGIGPARAQGLLGGGEQGDLGGVLIEFDSRTGDGALTITTSLSPDPIKLSLPGLPSVPLLIRPGTEVTLDAELPSGFALTSAVCSQGVEISNPDDLHFVITLQVSIEDALTCTFNAVNALRETTTAIVPFLMRRGDMLMGLDMGLDRQIDILTSGGASSGTGGLPKSSGLGGPSVVGLGEEPWGASRSGLGAPSAPSSFGFATSLRQMEKAAPPYALGATSRSAPPPNRKFDVWAEGYWAHFDDEVEGSGSDGEVGVLYLGADYLVSSNFLFGALVQFDDADQDFDFLSRRASTTGWMIGPYATARLTNNLFLQGRAAWGQSDNDLNLQPGFTDRFDTERWLVRSTLLGLWHHGPWQFRPRASVGYFEEDQETYLSSYGVVIPGQTVSLGQAKAGSQFAYQQRLADGTVVEPNVLIEGIWNFHQDASGINIDDLISGEEWRARAEAGLMFVTPGGVALGASVSYDGIGSDDYEAIGGRARLRVPLD